MIVLKILLWILLAVLGIVLILLVLPVRAEISYIGNELKYKLKYSFILLYNSDKKGVVSLILKWREKKKAAKEDKDEPPDSSSTDEDSSEEEVSSTALTVQQETSPTTEFSEAAPEPESSEAEPDDELTEDKPSKRDRKKKKDKDELPDDTEAAEEKGGLIPEPLLEKIEFFLDIWRAADRPILRIFKGFKLSELYIDFIIANEDAYKCALNYGRISGAVYYILGWLSAMFNVKLKTVDINPGFALSEPRWDVAVKLSFRPVTAVIAGIGFLLTYLFRYFIPGKLQERKLKKSAARQK